MGAEPLIIIPHDPLVKLLLPVPTTLCSASLVVLVLEGGMLPRRYNDSSELEVKTAVSHFGLLMPGPTDKEGSYGADWGD